MNKNIKAVIEEHERLKTVERTTRGRRRSAASGNVLLHGDLAPFGYRLSDDKKSLVVHQSEAEIVRLVFQWYVEGDENGQHLRHRQIASRLTEMNVPSVMDQGTPRWKRRPVGEWAPTSVGYLLRNETYVGVWNYGRKSPRGINPKAHWIPAWLGSGYDELRLWSESGGWPYAGALLVRMNGEAVARVVWRPDPKGFDESRAGEIARVEPGLHVENDATQTLRVSTHMAIVRLDVQPGWQGRGLGSYLLDRALAEMAAAGHRSVEVQTHITKHARAYAMYTRRGFTLQDAWASLRFRPCGYSSQPCRGIILPCSTPSPPYTANCAPAGAAPTPAISLCRRRFAPAPPRPG